MKKLLQNSAQECIERAVGQMFSSNLLDRDTLKTDNCNKCFHFGCREEDPVSEDRYKELLELIQQRKIFESVTSKRVIEKPFVCELHNAHIMGPQPLVRTRTGHIALESASASYEIFEHRATELIKKYGPCAIKFLRGNKISHDRHYKHLFPMVRHPTTNYYHWLLTGLIRLRSLEAYRKKTGERPSILINKKAPDWVYQSLELLGVDLDRCIHWTNSIAKVDAFVLPIHRRTRPLEAGSSDCHWLKKEAIAGLDPEPQRDDRRIFISREDADCRQVINRDCIDPILDKYGFEKRLLTKYTFSQQVRLFAEAEAVVAPHGAGLANLVFGTDLSVIELLPRNDVRPFYFLLANNCNHNYEYILCEGDNGDISVQPSQLEKYIKSSIMD